MNEEYLIGLFRKALIEAKAENLATLGFLMRPQLPDPVQMRQLVDDNERFEERLRDEKSLRRLAKLVIEAAK